jgi:ABC-type polar amino acid transport system ATPase subunit
MQPKIMLFDEPTSALDPEMIKRSSEPPASRDDNDCGTHEMGFAREVANRFIFMDVGHLSQVLHH